MSVGSKPGQRVIKILSTQLESTLLICRWFKGARQMEALSRGVRKLRKYVDCVAVSVQLRLTSELYIEFSSH